ncbi:hypothetical protein Bp8pC_187 [Bacillus phage Bp8p-C]|uniref:Uncharacterized protein n=2 Tax=Agatevirus Bp8pC TaxID=1910937 RepID=A0A0A0PLS7_9CAUD|nr:hypothetical protein AXJ20_gp161 [Bacillus phage Bp8p-C]YP_009784487.1 hypothetical protein QLX39_gp161 [Bacillus phage Bp8p-T]AHJ87617.1 hypothetical protein Bp8pC_187 [Bacillus phage Bp8p-C]AHJ87828.1 hypothetical protein Bp8pT_187 [Bacillus phage Bp8p-T]
MEKFRTVNQLMNQLKEDDYKFQYANNDNTYTYWDSIGRIAIVNLQERTIQYNTKGK